jgi:hypothetical protein
VTQARPHRPILIALGLLAATLVLLALARPVGAKEVVDALGPVGDRGGQLSNPQGVAVNSSGAGGVAPGTIYVVDGLVDAQRKQNRVQRFAPNGDFERAWGKNVTGRDERQLIELDGISSQPGGEGTYTLTFGGVGGAETAPIDGLASREQVERALAALPSIGAGNVAVFHSTSIAPISFEVRFGGPLSGTDLPELIVDGANLVPAAGGPPPTASVTTLENGSGGNFAGFEICTVAPSCQRGAPLTVTAGNVSGGQLDDPSGIAINQASGDVYVLNSGANRVEQFDADGNFIRAWGRDVVISGGTGDVPGTNEEQTVTLDANTNGGTFTLSFTQIFGLSSKTTTDPIPFNATPAQVRSALEELDDIGTGDVEVTSPNPGGGAGPGGPYTIEFVAGLADTNVNQISGNADGLTVSSGAKSVTVATTVAGASSFEVCSVPADCKGGQGTEDGGSLRVAQAIAIDPAGNVWVTGAGNDRFDVFDSAGNFVAAHGWDVDAAGGSGGLETCTSAAPGACQAAVEGSAPGQFAVTPAALAFDSSANLYVIDRGNGRVQKFDPAVTSASVFANGLSNPRSVLSIPGNHLLLSVNPSSGGQLLELDSTGAIVEASLVGTGIPQFGALARNEATGTIYATVENNSSSFPDADPHGILVIDDGPTPAPQLTLDPIATFDDSTATLSGAVDPVGRALGECKFQYSTDQANWVDVGFAEGTGTLAFDSSVITSVVATKGAFEVGQTITGPDIPLGSTIVAVTADTITLSRRTTHPGTTTLTAGGLPSPCATLDTDGGPQPVEDIALGLEPGAHYYVRLIAGRPYNPDATATSDEEEFTALSLPPVLSDLGAVRIADTSAHLVVRVKPRSQLTDYRFQYTTTDFANCGLSANPSCHETPEAEFAGSAEVVVSQQASGLAPGTDYDFRAIASNVAGTTESGVESFHTRAEPLPNPDDRGYEQVTPAEKNFNEVGMFGDPLVGWNGEAAAFPVITSLEGPGNENWSTSVQYVGRRGAGGWHPVVPSPPVCAFDLDDDGFVSSPQQVVTLSPNLDRAVLSRSEYANCPVAPLDPAAPPQTNLYLADLDTNPPSHRLLTPAVGAHAFGRASSDFEHVVYSSTGQQTPDAPAGNFDKLFAWREGEIKLVSRAPSGDPFASDSSAAGISEDGLRIFFQNSGEIYLRFAGVLTYHVSQSECTSACGSAAAESFRAATPDGAKALFTSAAKLSNEDTASSGADLYLYTHSANPPADQNLTLLSKDSEPADGTSASVLGLSGLSEDGKTVFFAANGQIVAGESTEPGPKLYRWDASGGSPTLTYLATLKESDSSNWGGAGLPEIRRVSAEGTALLIQTGLALEPLADQDGDLDVYRWQEAGGWECASCQLPGVASEGEASFSGAGAENNAQPTNAMSADGKRIFFETGDALLSADTNGQRDVYQWHDGALSPISTGIGSEDVEFAGASLSGHDVFFVTRERLVGWDTDDNTDLYDARIGGGFPEPLPEPAPCEGEACRGAPTGAPANLGAGSAVFEGPGNPKGQSRKGCPKGKRMARRNGKSRCVKRKGAAKRERAADRKRRAQR